MHEATAAATERDGSNPGRPGPQPLVGTQCGTQRDHDDDIADPGTDDASIAMDIEDESDDASGRLHKVNNLKLCCQWPDSDVTVDSESEIIDLRLGVTINEPVLPSTSPS